MPPLDGLTTMHARPLTLGPRFVRAGRLFKLLSRGLTSATSPSSGHRPWSYPPASVSIDNDQVAKLASKPLHSLTLADLVQ